MELTVTNLSLIHIYAFAERWTGRRIKEEEAKELSGITNYKYVAAFRNDLSRQLFSGNVKKVYLDFDKVYENTDVYKRQVSSCFILVRPSATGENEVLAMGDCAINLKPSEDQLAEIAWEVAECGKHFGIDPKVAFLSYSTLGSGKGEDVDKMRNAAAKAKELYPSLPIEGELQFDAAVSCLLYTSRCV